MPRRAEFDFEQMTDDEMRVFEEAVRGLRTVEGDTNLSINAYFAAQEMCEQTFGAYADEVMQVAGYLAILFPHEPVTHDDLDQLAA